MAIGGENDRTNISDLHQRLTISAFQDKLQPLASHQATTTLVFLIPRDARFVFIGTGRDVGGDAG